MIFPSHRDPPEGLFEPLPEPIWARLYGLNHIDRLESKGYSLAIWDQGMNKPLAPAAAPEEQLLGLAGTREQAPRY